MEQMKDTSKRAVVEAWLRIHGFITVTVNGSDK